MKEYIDFLFKNGDFHSTSKDGIYSKENIANTLLYEIHPKQIDIEVHLRYTIFKVAYEYTTNRGNRRKGSKFLFIEGLNPQIDMDKKLSKYVKGFNIENKHRQLSNVKILGSKCLGYIKYPK